jgi:hypothetical protein
MTIVDCQSHVFPPADAELLTCNRGRLQTTGGAMASIILPIGMSSALS